MDNHSFMASETKGQPGTMSFNRFITLWTHPDYPPHAVSEDELSQAEVRLQTKLPAEYRNAILQFGLPRPTIQLLDTIVDRELDLRDVSDFLSPTDLVAVTEDWREMGLPEGLVAFATDCMGNLFCFPTEGGTEAEGSIVFFDHDDQTVDLIAPSFIQWVDEFCGLAPH
jgi:hypothetical protein